jgi:hypothetical protein
MTIFAQILEVSGNKRINRDGSDSNITLQASPQSLNRLLLDEESLTETVKAKFKQVFDKYQELVDLCTKPSATLKLGFKVIPNSAFDPAPDFLVEEKVGHVKTFSPLELVATAILVSVHGRSRKVETLINDIKKMRYYLREAHKDLRLNNQCWATAWQFIDAELTKPCGNEVSAPNAGSTTNVDEPQIIPSSPDIENGVAVPAALLLSNGAGDTENSETTDVESPARSRKRKHRGNS